jgi:hypothetical protein
MGDLSTCTSIVVSRQGGGWNMNREIARKIEEAERIKQEIREREAELLTLCPASRYVWEDGAVVLDRWRFGTLLTGGDRA